MQDNPGSLLKLIQQHLSWYPLMEPRDIYKLLFQGVMGSEHMIPTRQEFIRRMYSEFERLQPDQHQRVLEPVRSDQLLFRLNLRAYKSQPVSIDQLFTALLESARLISGCTTELQTVWGVFVQLCEQGHISKFNISTIQRFTHWLEQMKFPAVHHSEIYRREYQPAYRLISAKFIPDLGLADAI